MIIEKIRKDIRNLNTKNTGKENKEKAVIIVTEKRSKKKDKEEKSMWA